MDLKNFNLNIKGLSAFAGIATVLGVGALWLAPQEKAKRLRIEEVQLKETKSSILEKEPTPKLVKKMTAIDKKLDYISLYFKSREA